MFNKAISAFEDTTCIQFRPYRERVDKAFVRILNSDKCWADIGYNARPQILFLAASCRSMGMIMHELAHTIGLIHELTHPKRDTAVLMQTDNIQPNFRREIEKSRSAIHEDDFDFQSITLYHPIDFYRNGFPVYLPRNSSERILPVHMKDLSFTDVKTINRMYKCDKKCTKTQTCPRPSFRDKNCKCVSPQSYSDSRCHDDPKKKNFCKTALLQGTCYSDDRVVPAYCRKTCNACFQSGRHGKHPEPPIVCIDLKDSRQCLRFYQNGFCFFDHWTMVNCAKTCNTCVDYARLRRISATDCVDRHNPVECQLWAKRGLCTSPRDVPFMQSNCPASCKMCSNNQSEVDLGPFGHVVPGCRNRRDDTTCEAWARQGLCVERVEQMQADCKLYCNGCHKKEEKSRVSGNFTGSTEIPHVAPECKDLDDLRICRYLKVNKMCNSNRRCRKTCDQCELPSQIVKSFNLSKELNQEKFLDHPESALYDRIFGNKPKKEVTIPSTLASVKRKLNGLTDILTTKKISTTKHKSRVTTLISKKPKTNCPDQHEKCAIWARHGHCRYTFTRNNCRQSCKIC